MPKTAVTLFLYLLLMSMASAADHPNADRPNADHPNIVFIMIDDLGWSDVGCYGNDFVETPHIDQLAQQGLRFTDFYAAGAVCSPTRCAVQSGQNQARIGITAHIPGHWRPFERVISPQTTMALPLDTVTVAESLQAAGYRTGYVGKWHLGTGAAFGPAKQGYEFAAEINGPHLPNKYRVSGRNDLKPKPGQFRGGRMQKNEYSQINEHLFNHRFASSLSDKVVSLLGLPPGSFDESAFAGGSLRLWRNRMREAMQCFTTWVNKLPTTDLGSREPLTCLQPK